MKVDDLILVSIGDHRVEPPDMFVAASKSSTRRFGTHCVAGFGSFRFVVKPLPLALQSGLPL